MTEKNKNIELSSFAKDYFMQTRKEIDTEKHERDRLLHFLIILIGGVLVLFTKEIISKEFSSSIIGILFHISFLVIITAIFWVRWKKLSQIADRWATLYKIIEKENEIILEDSLERKVKKGFEEKRYIRKDICLCLSFSLPIYLSLLFGIFSNLNKNLVHSIIVAIIIVLHIVFSYLILWKKPIDMNLFK